MPPSRGRIDPASGQLGFALIALPFALLAVCGGVARAQTDAQAGVQAPAVGDRYSGEVYVRPAFRSTAPASGPTLTWPGKALAAAPTADPVRVYRAAAYQQAPAYPAQSQQRSSAAARAYGPAPVMPWYQRFGGAAEASSAPLSGAPAPAAALPRSIYDPPPSQPRPASGASTSAASAPSMAPTTSAAAGGETARFYSVHRQYGLTPDPDPIPPQFFSQTADLSDPPGPNAVYKTAAASGGSTTAVHPVQSEDASSSLGQP